MQGKLVLWILFRNRKLHTLNDRGELLSFESFGIGNTSKVTVIASILELNRGQDLHGSIPYLVECFDGRPNHSCSIFWFSLCRWLWIRCYSPPSCFRVFKLASINSRWDEVKNIGIHILFLGFNSSFSISSLHFPQYEGNHIYFADSNLSIFSKFYKQEVLVFLIWGMEFLRHYQVSNLILNFCGLHPFRWTLLKVTFVGWYGSKSCSYRPIFQVRSTKSHPFHLYVQTPDLYSVLIVSEEKRNIYLNSFIIPFLFSIIFF